MFILHSSNKTENLVAHLASVLEHAPLQSPLSAELFLIQSLGMERWLFQQLATYFKVWANYRFLFPDHFFTYIARQLEINLQDTVFDRHQLLWRFEALLRNPDKEDCAALHAYLSGSQPGLKRFQLARQLAALFDQYQIMRPDLLTAWQKGQLVYGTSAERWQKHLWLALTAVIGQRHRGSLWLDVIEKLNSTPENALADCLPERISVVGINAMPPLFLTYLQSLAKHCEVHLFLLNPAQAYWADLANKRKGDLADASAGHPLLASLGQQGREFQEMLLDLTQFDFQPESFEEIEKPNNLQQLQNDILNNTLSGRALVKDSSISLHACHSRKREVEVLKDQILMALKTDPALELRDIAVMAPDIQLYEPFISAVFHDIQHAIADRSLQLDNRILDAFIRFLELSQSRLGWQSVLDVLELEAVYTAFGLSETDLDLIKYWIEDTHIRWGESGRHKAELGLPALEENTWGAALNRLLMGYAVGDESHFVLGILPYKHIEGASASALGGLHDFLALLFKARMEFKQPRNLKSWGALFSGYLQRLLGDAWPLEKQPLNELFQELSGTFAEFHNEPVELAVILQWLQSRVSERKSSSGFLRGQLTFCSMLPMRSIPFKVIALMGLNEGEFPKTDRAPTFDLISQHFRKGDRSHRKDDRYQFLEILLSARQQLIITYTGQSQHTNEPIPPSVVVSELLDTLKEDYGLGGMVTSHPLQAFSPRYFNGQSDLFSFSQSDCETARALSASKDESKLWWTGIILTETQEAVDLDDFLAYFQHPQRYFLRKHFGWYGGMIQAEPKEREPFSLGEINTYRLNQEWVDCLLKGSPFSAAKLKAQGRWLPGMAGDLSFEQQQAALADYINRIQAVKAGGRLPPCHIDLKVGKYRLVGQIPHCYEQHNLIYRYAGLKGKDFISAWLCHLILNSKKSAKTYLLTADHDLVFSEDQANQDELLSWLEIYEQGRSRPDAFFTEPAFAYAWQSARSKASSKVSLPPLNAARNKLIAALESGYEIELRQLFGNLEQPELLLTEEHAGQFDSLLVPVWEKAHGN